MVKNVFFNFNVYLYISDGKEGYWIINAKDGSGSVEFNGKGKWDKSFGLKGLHTFSVVRLLYNSIYV